MSGWRALISAAAGLVLACAVAGWVVVAFTHTGHPASRRTTTATVVHQCIQLVAGPTKIFACDDGLGYAVARGRVSDIGPATSIPQVPAA